MRPAHRTIPRAADGALPVCWLLAEWPAAAADPTDYWLSTLGENTALAELVRLAKIRWRIEHDYRELKHGLGLDHFEGRTWIGWHHHTTEGHHRPRRPRPRSPRPRRRRLSPWSSRNRPRNRG